MRRYRSLPFLSNEVKFSARLIRRATDEISLSCHRFLSGQCVALTACELDQSDASPGIVDAADFILAITYPIMAFPRRSYFDLQVTSDTMLSHHASTLKGEFESPRMRLPRLALAVRSRPPRATHAVREPFERRSRATTNKCAPSPAPMPRRYLWRDVPEKR